MKVYNVQDYISPPTVGEVIILDTVTDPSTIWGAVYLNA